MQLIFLAGFFAHGFASPALARLVPVVLATAFAFTSWHDALARVPFALDPSAVRPPTLTASYALVAAVLLRLLQVQIHVAATRAGWYPPFALVLSFLTAGSAVVTASLLWFRYRGLSRLRERLGLGLGAGVGVTVREGVLWSVPAIAVSGVFWWLSRSGLRSAESQVTALGMLAQGSAWAFAAMTVLAAPLLEEILFRGMLYRSLRSHTGATLSLLLSSAVFAVGHPQVAVIPVFCMSVCATLAFERSRSLFAAVLVHTLYNGFIAAIVLSH